MDSPFASQVNLAGDFNGWEMTTLALRKDADGLWRITVELKPGAYAYKFLVDGQWVNDPNNPRTAANQFGSLNNVIEVA
jgi:1,4-alpha-glucan branching enzyme